LQMPCQHAINGGATCFCEEDRLCGEADSGACPRSEP
jgi:hypothetical protein